MDSDEGGSGVCQHLIATIEMCVAMRGPPGGSLRPGVTKVSQIWLDGWARLGRKRKLQGRRHSRLVVSRLCYNRESKSNRGLWLGLMDFLQIGEYQ